MFLLQFHFLSHHSDFRCMLNYRVLWYLRCFLFVAQALQKYKYLVAIKSQIKLEKDYGQQNYKSN